VPAAFAAGAVAWAISTGIQGSPTISAIIALVVGGAVYAGVALGIGSFLYDRLTARSVAPSSADTPQ
jgi:hypothetical protein